MFEQCEHVVGTVGRPEGKLPMSIQIERTAPMNGLEARVSHADFTIKLRMSSTPWFTDYTAILAHNFMRFQHICRVFGIDLWLFSIFRLRTSTYRLTLAGPFGTLGYSRITTRLR